MRIQGGMVGLAQLGKEKGKGEVKTEDRAAFINVD
jgi:hypothetical protein